MTSWRGWMLASSTPDSTVGLRLYHLARLARAVPEGPAAVTLDQLTAFLASSGWQPNTRRSWRGSVRAFYSWALAAGVVAESPALLLPPVRVPRGRPRPTPEEAFRDALVVADERVRLALLLAGVHGLRRGEVSRLRREDVAKDLLGWSLRVTGKGGHVRLVPLTEDVAAEIRRRPVGWLFPSPRGGGHLTPHHLGKLVSARLPEGYTMHTLRHRCGTVAYAATRDLRAVQELLGHARPETTALYTAVPDGAIRSAVLAADASR